MPTPLQKQYMSSTPKSKTPAVARPSASILLISPSNQILLLHRVRTSSSFPSAHVFPGGNLEEKQDGPVPKEEEEGRHRDGEAYRRAAVRECFEESGILLARKRGEGSGGKGALLEVVEGEREWARKEIHAGRLGFGEWVEEKGGVLDTESLLPFTRWITPAALPKRFTTQMYIYFLPLLDTSPTTSTPQNPGTETSVIPTPTSDGGLEHTAALFAHCSTFLEQASKAEIILFPPQFYLLNLLAPLLPALPPAALSSTQTLQAQRTRVISFLQTDGDGKGVAWGEKVMSPIGLSMTADGRSVLGLDKPGVELEGSERRGDERRVVLVRFVKEGPREVEVRERREVLEEIREGKARL